MTKKIKIPGWALLKKSDIKWVSHSRLGWLYEQTYLDQQLFTIGYYYSQIIQQYNYYTEGPKIKISKSFDIQTILFGRSFNGQVSSMCEKKAFKILKHWNHIDECLKKLSKERLVVEPLLKSVLNDDLFPRTPLHYWVPFFKKGLHAISEGIK